jgi:uncharacterized protein YecT (DUF1311 family)
MADCLNAKTAYWDKRLDAAYKQALKDALRQQRSKLLKAQMLWSRYREPIANFTAKCPALGPASRLATA